MGKGDGDASCELTGPTKDKHTNGFPMRTSQNHRAVVSRRAEGEVGEVIVGAG